MSDLKELETIVESLSKGEGPTEENYKKLISSVDNASDVDSKKLLAQNISKFFEKFPSTGKEGLEAEMKLLGDEDVSVRSFAVRGIFDFVSVSPSSVIMTLVPLVHSEDGQVATMAKTNFRQHLPKSDRVFLTAFNQTMHEPERTCDEKNEMVRILTDYMEFDADRKDYLLSAVDTALEADTVNGIKLMRRYPQLFSPKERDDRINTFFNSLFLKLNSEEQEVFQNAVEHILIPSISSIPLKEGTAGQRLFVIIAEQVLPRILTIEEKYQSIAIRLIADQARFANDNGIQELVPSIYEHLFCKIGAELKNLFIVEPVLFLINTLSKRAPSLMIDQFGVQFTSDGTKRTISEEKKETIRRVTDFIKEDADPQIKVYEQELEKASEEEKKKKTKQTEKFTEAANNCLVFAAWLSSKNPSAEKKPKNPSWGKSRDKKPAQQQPKSNYKSSNFRNDREYGYGDRRGGRGGRGGYGGRGGFGGRGGGRGGFGGRGRRNFNEEEIDGPGDLE